MTGDALACEVEAQCDRLDVPANQIVRLAWLVRADLRGDEAPDATLPDWFGCWWSIEGRREYPAWAGHASSGRESLFELVPNWPNYRRFGMTRALHYLWQRRTDLQQAFAVSNPSGLWQAIAWFFTHGVREAGIIDGIDETTLAELDLTPPFLPLQPSASVDQPALTWLMFFVWRCAAELQTRFDLRTRNGQTDYLHWFLLEGVPTLELAPLLAPRWCHWLGQKVSLKGHSARPVSRATLLLWQRRAGLQRAFDLRKPDAWVELARWEQQVWDVEPALSWLGAPSVRRPTAEQDSIAHLHAPVALASEVQQPPSSKTTDRRGLRAVTASGLCAPSGQRQATLGDRPLGLNLIGFAFGELGIGEDVRMAAAACAAVGIAFKVVNIHPGDQLRQSDRYLSDHVDANSPTEDEAPYAFNLFCLTGFDTVRVFLERGMSLFSGRYNIGWWPWELPVWPKQWDLAFDLVNEVWAATDFTYRTYSQASQRRARPPTVAWMPLPASIARVSKRTRAQLGLPHGKFLFLYVFDFNSYLARKNPLAALKAFRQAFAVDNNSVGLVFKTMNSQPDNPDWRRFEQSCAQDGRVVLMNQTLERGEVLGLIEACDAYVSLHRSEGFGRTLAEAMLLGKPVVGTNFSGNVDFLSETSGFPVKWRRRAVKPGDYPFVSASDAPWWAEPNIADAARQMQRAKMACADRAWVSRVTQLAQETFSPERIGNRMLARLQSIHAAQHS